MPRIIHRNRPSWYNAGVSKEVGRVAGVTTRPAFLDSYMGMIWNNKKAATTHPMAHTRLVQVRPPAEKLSPQLQLDSKSSRRAAMFARQGVSIAERAMDDLKESGSANTPRQKNLVSQWNNANAARKMHEFMSPERVFRSAYHSVKPNQTLPYRPASVKPARAQVPLSTGPRATPRIAGVSAASILKGTGALGLLPGIVYLSRGGTIGGLAGPLPPRYNGVPYISGQF